MLTAIIIISLLLAFSKRDGKLWMTINQFRNRLLHSSDLGAVRARQAIRTASSLSVATMIFLLFCNWRVEQVSKEYLFSDTDTLPKNHTAIVIGTTKFLRNGDRNPFYHSRINATAELYDMGKIKNIIITSDSRKLHPVHLSKFKTDLVRKGIPSDSIFEEYYNLKPYESILRTIEIFHTNDLTVVSHSYQAKSAIYLARNKGINAISYELDDNNTKFWGFKIKMKEYIRRIRLFYDIYINKKPINVYEDSNILA